MWPRHLQLSVPLPSGPLLQIGDLVDCPWTFGEVPFSIFAQAPSADKKVRTLSASQNSICEARPGGLFLLDCLFVLE